MSRSRSWFSCISRAGGRTQIPTVDSYRRSRSLSVNARRKRKNRKGNCRDHESLLHFFYLPFFEFHCRFESRAEGRNRNKASLALAHCAALVSRFGRCRWWHCVRRRTEGLAVRKHDRLDTPDEPAALGCDHGDADLIPSLKRFPGPSAVDQICWRRGFRNPVCDGTFLIRHIEFQPAMGIGPHPLRDCGLHGDFCRVECRVPMVCEQRQ